MSVVALAAFAALELTPASDAAAKCDAAAFDRAVAEIEDRAFAAAKRAHEAVAQAAVKGAVGTAGDAEWAAYKSLMQQAHQARVEHAGALARCKQGPMQQVTAAAPPQAMAPAARPLTSRVSVSTAYMKGSPTPLPGIAVYRLPGTFGIGSEDPNAPIAGASFGAGSPDAARPTGEVTPAFSSRVQEREIRLGFDFAPKGLSEAGWQMGVDLGWSRGSAWDRLQAPLAARAPQADLSAPRTVICILFSTFTGTCRQYSISVPASREVYEVGGGLNNAITNYHTDQESRRVLGEARLGRTFATNLPVVDRVGVHARLGGEWMSLDQRRYVSGVPAIGGYGPSFADSLEVKVDGPIARAAAGLELGGPVPLSPIPVRWSVSGDYGREWVSVDGLGQSGQSLKVDANRPTWSAGAALEVQLTSSASIGLEYQRVSRAYFALRPSVAGADGALRDGSGMRLDVGSAEMDAYRLSIRQSF